MLGVAKLLKGVLDRIEDGDMAVILIENLGEQFEVPVCDLPEGSEEGTWFIVDRCDDAFVVVEIDEETTKKEAHKSEDLLAQLRAKSKGSKYKRK